VFQNVFMAVEMPGPFTAPAEGESYETIGQFYKAIDEGLIRCVTKYGTNEVFKQAEGVRQRNDIYLGKFGGRAILVHDLARAKRAIRQIVEQGEGAVDPTRPLVADQPWGTYDYYGHRLDGTYGPILGTPYELSHYFKFKRIVESGKFPATYPTVSNPRISDFTNQEAQQAAVTFNKYYSIMLNSLEKAFRTAPGDRDVYFEVTLPLMHSHLPQLAAQLVVTPIMTDGDPSVGPNAAATFEYVAGATMSDLIATVESLATAQPRAHIRTLAASRRPIASTALPVPAERAHRRPEVLTKLADNLRQLYRLSERAGFGL
jgi:ferritin-like protein